MMVAWGQTAAGMVEFWPKLAQLGPNLTQSGQCCGAENVGRCSTPKGQRVDNSVLDNSSATLGQPRSSRGSSWITFGMCVEQLVRASDSLCQNGPLWGRPHHKAKSHVRLPNDRPVTVTQTPTAPEPALGAIEQCDARVALPKAEVNMPGPEMSTRKLRHPHPCPLRLPTDTQGDYCLLARDRLQER